MRGGMSAYESISSVLRHDIDSQLTKLNVVGTILTRQKINVHVCVLYEYIFPSTNYILIINY